MKFAVIGSGQTRKLLRTQLNKTFDSVNKDFYFHTWDHAHNPNWKKLQSFFPDATIQVERYEDKFDNYSQIRNIGNVDQLRYHFAQFYTVLKSFKLVNKEYDFYFRTRTDIGYSNDALEFFDPSHRNWEFFKRMTWHALKNTTSQETWRELVSDNENLLVNNEDIENKAINIKPIIWAGLRMHDPIHGVLFDDFSWTMNHKAFKLMQELDIDEIMKKAINLKKDKEMRVQSPLIWSAIIKELGIYLIYAPVTGRITRNKVTDQQIVAQYGDIT
jgi:hypothetical protein